jgi:hypothetical protein
MGEAKDYEEIIKDSKAREQDYEYEMNVYQLTSLWSTRAC